jgi:hypothetical protein
MCLAGFFAQGVIKRSSFLREEGAVATGQVEIMRLGQKQASSKSLTEEVSAYNAETGQSEWPKTGQRHRGAKVARAYKENSRGGTCGLGLCAP